MSSRKRKSFAPEKEGSIPENSARPNEYMLKKLKFNEAPSFSATLPSSTEPQNTSKFHLEKTLPNLTKEQLLDIISSLVSQFPQLETPLTSLLPRPTLESMVAMFTSLEKKLEASFPYSKNGPDRSDYSFNRTRPVLEEIIETMTTYLNYFTNPSSFSNETMHEYPSNALGYLNICTNLVHRLPVWDSEAHNVATRHTLYSKLYKSWSMVIREVGKSVEKGKVFGSLFINEWTRNLSYHNEQVKGHFGFNQLLYEFDSFVNVYSSQNFPWPMTAASSNLMSSHVQV